MSDKEFIHLIEKYLEGKCSPSERERVEQWYEEQATESHNFYDDDEEQIRSAAERSLAIIRKRAAAHTFELTDEESDVSVGTRRNILLIRRLAAAVVFLATSAFIYLYFSRPVDIHSLSKI